MKNLLLFTFITTITLFICSKSTAQVPGYMGKKFNVQYTSQFHFHSKRPGYNYMNRDAQNFFGRISLEHGLQLEYILGRKWTANVSYSRVNLGFNHERTTYNYRPASDTMVATRNRTIGFAFVAYPWRKKSLLAPLGTFTGLGLDHTKMKLVLRTSDDDGLTFNKGYSDLQEVNDIDFKFFIGRQFIAQDFVTIKYGLIYSLPLKMLTSGNVSSYYDDPDHYESERNESIAQNRVGYATMIQIFFAIGGIF